MSEPVDPKSDNVPAPDPKGKGLDKFIGKVVDGKPSDQKVIIRTDELPPEAIDDKDFKEEFEKLQKKQYNTERRIALDKLEDINPEVAEKYKSKKLSDIETALDVAKVSSPKFPVNREAPQEPAAPRSGHLNRRNMKWE